MSISAVEIAVPKAESVKVTTGTLRVDLDDGRTISVPLAWFPRLYHATRKECANWRLVGKGQGIHWGDQSYHDGWRPGSWDGFSPEFTHPAPWYFRTIESWVELLRESHFEVLACREPVHPKTKKPASIIFIGRSA